MALDLWFRDDMNRMLASAGQRAARYEDGDYRKGYLDALADIGVALGLVVPKLPGDNGRAPRAESSPLRQSW